jgi:anti-sigma B factor antagonist
MAVNQLEVEVRLSDGRAVLDLYGDVDAYTGPSLSGYLDAAVNENAGDVHLNLSKVKFVDSSGIAVFVAAAKRLRDRGNDLVVEATPPNVAKVLEMTGVTKLIRLDARRR